MSTVINGVSIDHTFAEAFGMSGTGMIITADTMKWARIAAVTATGFGTYRLRRRPMAARACAF